jgi:hypothetical protein
MDGDPIRPGHPGPPAPHAQTPPPPAAHPAEPAAMSMERIDFLLARAEATLRAAAAERGTPARPGPGPGFSRVADPTTAAEGGAPAATAAPSSIAAGRRGGSRGGYADEMRRMADGGRAVSEVLAAKPGKKRKGRSLASTPPRNIVLRMKTFPKLFSSGCLPRLGCRSASVRAQQS